MRTDDTSVGGISLSGYIFNAAGPKDATYEELLPLAWQASRSMILQFSWKHFKTAKRI
jgi:hypothetical protein